ncbi:hypothetical protein [Posidoniimonas polymericola]|uniref:hypothetical protein n=1 Tax=Posidoniimonas polymericola TaxID=2528002 RepID=UPI0011B51A1C|nr:hypothetical protein [Posidoniimonas polymericola]
MHTRQALLADAHRLRALLADTAADLDRLGDTEAASRLNQLTALSQLDEIVADVSALDDHPRDGLLARLWRRLEPCKVCHPPRP